MANWGYEQFTAEVDKLIDIDLSAYNERQMKRRVDSFISRHKLRTYKEFCSALAADKELREKFIDYLTINVTEFFRNPEQWEKMSNEIIPKLLKLSQPLKIWSAACSTGEEPYSMVMLLHQVFGSYSGIKILATDIDERAIDKARSGIYDKKELKNMPESWIKKFFYIEDNTCTVKDEVKACVEFKKLNLLKDPYPKDLHLILCRNVMIYFTQETKERIYSLFHSSLKPGGVLFLGSTEQIIYPDRYGFMSLKSFFYEKIEKSRTTSKSLNIQTLG